MQSSGSTLELLTSEGLERAGFEPSGSPGEAVPGDSEAAAWICLALASSSTQRMS